jgi:hypothetical protein
MSISTPKQSPFTSPQDEKCESTQKETTSLSGSPEVTCKWNGSNWEILDNGVLVNPRQKNLLIQRLRLFVNRQFRLSRAKARAEQQVNNEVVVN